jgi:hypothetical protein
MYLIRIEGPNYPIMLGTATDEAGRWFAINIGTGTYTLLYRSPGEWRGPLPGQWEVRAGQITDFGDINLPDTECS